ncbi:hypothetical protein D3C72_1176050 [compost metagenome]
MVRPAPIEGGDLGVCGAMNHRMTRSYRLSRGKGGGGGKREADRQKRRDLAASCGFCARSKARAESISRRPAHGRTCPARRPPRSRAETPRAQAFPPVPGLRQTRLVLTHVDCVIVPDMSERSDGVRILKREPSGYTAVPVRKPQTPTGPLSDPWRLSLEEVRRQAHSGLVDPSRSLPQEAGLERHLAQDRQPCRRRATTSGAVKIRSAGRLN